MLTAMPSKFTDEAEEYRMALNKVELCGVDTSRLPVLTNAEMKVLFERIAAGDETAREEFIGGNLRLVLSVVQRFANRGEMMDDLFQVGCIGLMKSIDNFDTTLGVRFSTYAVPMIIGEIRRYLRDNNAIRVSRSMRDTAYKALRARDQLAERLGREPNETELAILTGMPVDTEEQAVAAARTLIARGAKMVLNKRGRAGALLVTAEESRAVPGFKVNAVDTTAAGDSFNAGLGVGLLMGMSMDDAIRLANAVGALSTTRAGAQPAMPSMAEAQALMG